MVSSEMREWPTVRWSLLEWFVMVAVDYSSNVLSPNAPLASDALLPRQTSRMVRVASCYMKVYLHSIVAAYCEFLPRNDVVAALARNQRRVFEVADTASLPSCCLYGR